MFDRLCPNLLVFFKILIPWFSKEFRLPVRWCLLWSLVLHLHNLWDAKLAHEPEPKDWARTQFVTFPSIENVSRLLSRSFEDWQARLAIFMFASHLDLQQKASKQGVWHQVILNDCITSHHLALSHPTGNLCLRAFIISYCTVWSLLHLLHKPILFQE